MSVGDDGYFYIEHVARMRAASGERDRAMVEIGRRDYEALGAFVILHQQDPGSAGVDSARATNEALAAAGLRARFEPVTGDKTVRAGPLAGMAQSGKVRIVRGEWNADFLDECSAFPNGRHDDQVDAAASAFNELLKLTRRARESRIL
jgi:predicted phage terminase large subunit-like protein